MTGAVRGARSLDAARVEAGGKEGRALRIAAVGDLHFGREGQGISKSLLSRLVTEAETQADVLLLCGDLTSHGSPEEARLAGEALKGASIPVVAVLGNHDHESGQPDEVRRVLASRGVHVLDGDAVEVAGVGIAGVKGFAGGFGRAALTAFGETIIKAFVQEALEEALKLENALRQLTTDVKVAMLHYSPIVDTLAGEPPEIQAFLGSSRLLPPLESMGVDVAFHGHAHVGNLEGRSPAGIPVFNVALPVLQSRDLLFHVWTAEANGGG